ncbi:MAG: oligosaccharide flippase family protein [Candidatus Marinimicrobia bacterium]|nr:oligosaccharide flippase family protein [Candidatus Neomarinimicrobiota bacterium]
MPVYTRVFSVYDYGVIDIFTVFTNLIIVTATLRLSTSISRYFSEKERGFTREELCSTLLYFNTCVNIIIFSLLFLLSEKISYLIIGNINAADFVVLSALAANFKSLSKVPMMVLRRERRIIVFSTINIISSILFAIISLILIFIFKLDLKGIFVAQVISNGLVFLGSLYSIRKLLILKINKIAIITSLKYSLPLMPGKYFMWFNEQVNRLMLLYIIGLSGVGIFAIGSRIASIHSLFISVFQKAWNPFSVEIINTKESKYIFKKTLTYYLGITFSAGIILSLLTPFLLRLLTTTEFYAGQVVVPWLIGAGIIGASSRIINIGTIITEKTFYNSKAEIITFVTNCIFSYILIVNIGINGVAIGMFISQLLSKSYLWNITKNISDINFEYNKVILLIFIYVICSITFTIQILNTNDHIILKNIHYLVCFLGMVTIFKIAIDKQLVDGLRNILFEVIQTVKFKMTNA